MPGRAMTSSQPEGAITTPRSRGKKAAPKFNPPYIKEEEDGDDYDEDTYRPRPQLPKPFVVMRSLADLIRDLDAGLIDVDPEYQREVVWTADRMTGLVNSLMENFYIPPIILNKKTRSISANDAPDGVNVCVDGKQRLSSVRAFVKGMIPCHDHQGEKWYFCEMPMSRRKKVLSESDQRAFLKKEFVSFEFKDLTQEQEEDLFARVQLGVQLSLAEKMRASSGPWQELGRLFVEDFPTVYPLMKDRARAKDFQLTLACFSQIVEVQHPTASDGIPILKTGASALQRLLPNKIAVDDKLKAHLASVWNTFKDLIDQDPDTFTNENKYLRGVQTFAPIEMVAVTVLISIYGDSRKNKLLLGDIKQMRETIREHFADIRMNPPVWKLIWEYINDLEAVRGAVDGSTVDRRVPQPAQPTNNTAVGLRSPEGPTPKAGTKRGRPTLRTKKPNILPPQEPFTVKKEEASVTNATDLPQPKRLRPDPSLLSPSSSVAGHPTDELSSTQSYNLPFMQPPPYLANFAAPQYASMSAHTTAAPNASIPARTTLALGNTSLPAGQTSTTPPTTPPFSPAALQSHLPGQDNYCTPVAPMATMASSVPTVPMPRLVQNQSMPAPTPDPAAKPTSTASNAPRVNGRSQFRTGRGAFTSQVTEQQWAGGYHPVTSPTRTAPSTPSNAQSQQKIHKGPPQYDGAIDLTSDGEEEERQNVLSAFRPRAVPAREASSLNNAARADRVPQANAGSIQQLPSRPPSGRPFVSNQEKEERNIPMRESNNPYVRFKTQGGNHLHGPR